MRACSHKLRFLSTLGASNNPPVLFPTRYTPCSYRGVEERLPHGSMSRLTDHSRHSSSHRLNEQSRHSSVRDLSSNPMTHITHGTSMNRVIEEDGTSA